MKPTLLPKSSSDRSRRIGRKVLHADRLSRALGTSETKKSTPTKWRSFKLQPKIAALLSVAIIGISGLGFAGSQLYSAQATKAYNAEVADQQSKAKADSARADACRRKKVEEKADQLGTLTYDELYDFGECDK